MLAWHNVAIADLESRHECIHRAYLNSEETWNGWACPYFEKPEVERMSAWLPEFDDSLVYDEITDTFTTTYDPDAPESFTGSRYIRATTHCAKAEESFLARYSENAMAKQQLIDDGCLAEDGSVYCPYATLSYAPKELILENRLFLNGQEEKAESLDPSKRHPVMSFFGGNLGKRISHTEERGPTSSSTTSSATASRA